MKRLLICVGLAMIASTALADHLDFSTSADNSRSMSVDQVFAWQFTMAGTGNQDIDSMGLYINPNYTTDTFYYAIYTVTTLDTVGTLLGYSSMVAISGSSTSLRLVAMQAAAGGTLTLTGGTTYYFAVQLRAASGAGGYLGVLTSNDTYRCTFTDAGELEAVAPAPVAKDGVADTPRGYLVYAASLGGSGARRKVILRKR
jgi:hypothetical protein